MARHPNGTALGLIEERTTMLKTLTVLLPAIAAVAGYSQPVDAASKASCDGILTDQRAAFDALLPPRQRRVRGRDVLSKSQTLKQNLTLLVQIFRCK